MSALAWHHLVGTVAAFVILSGTALADPPVDDETVDIDELAPSQRLVVPEEGPLRVEVELTPTEQQVLVHLRSNGADMELWQTITGSAVVTHPGAFGSGYRAYFSVGRSLLECAASCGRMVDRRAKYVVKGRGVVDSASFRLLPDASEMTIDVKPGLAWQRHLGMGLLGIGAVATVVGAVLLIKFASLDKALHDPGFNPGLRPTESEASAFRNTGLGVLAVGLAVAASGVVTVLLGRTTVSVVAGAPQARVRLIPGGLAWR